MPPIKTTKPYAKLAGSLVLVGMSLFMLERFGLNWMRGPNGTGSTHINGTVLSILVAAPVILIIGGCIVFAVGSMLKPR
jgi:hypothetical protein